MTASLDPTAAEVLAELALVDHHCHGVVADPLDRAGVEALLSEGGPPPAGLSNFDTPVGLAVRRWCAPVLGLEPHASAEAYLARRAALGPGEVNRRLLRGSGTGDFLLDTGYQPDAVLAPDALAAATQGRAHEVVRLEVVAESVAAGGTDAASYAGAVEAALDAAAADAVGLKTIVAYRLGLDIDPEPPTAAEVARAAGDWLRRSERRGSYRMDDPVLVRHLLWTGIRRGLPLQFHIGYGDPDIVLYRTDPSRMTGFLKATAGTGVPIMLLHCYPFHREAAYLAAVLPHVYLDVGLTIPYVGASAAAVLAEVLELAPFGKVLYSSDAFGLAELYLLGATLFRHALARVLDEWLADDAVTPADAARIARQLGAENARRVYRLAP